MSMTGGFGEEPIIMRMQMTGTSMFVGDVDAMMASLRALTTQLEANAAAAQANSAAITKLAAAQASSATTSTAAAASSAAKSTSFLSAASGRLKTMGQGMKIAGEKLTRGLTLPLVALGTVAIASSLKFNKAMLLIHTAAGRPMAEVARMSKYITGTMRGKTPFDPQQLALAAAQIEKIGYTGKTARQILWGSAEAAAIGGGSVVEMAGIVSGAKTAQVPGLGTPKHTAALINAAAGVAGTTLPEFTQAFGTGILPYGKLYGFNFKDILAALSLAADEHMKPSVAAARMRTGFAYLATPTLKGQTELSRLGIGPDVLANIMRDRGPHGGMKAVLDRLNQGLLGAGPEGGKWNATGKGSGTKYMDALMQILPTGRGAIIAQLLNQRNRIGFKENQITRLANNVDPNFVKTMQNPSVKLTTAIANLKTAFVLLGNVLVPVVIPAIVKLIHWISDGIALFGKLPKSLRTGILIFLAFAVAIGPILVVVGNLVLVFSLLLTPVGLVILAIALLTAGFIYAYTHFKFFHDAVDFVWSILKELAGWFINNWKTVLLVAFAPILLFPILVYRNWGKIVGFFKGIFSPLVSDAKAFIKTIEHLLHLLHIDLGSTSSVRDLHRGQVVGRYGTGASIFGPQARGGARGPVPAWHPYHGSNGAGARYIPGLGANPMDPANAITSAEVGEVPLTLHNTIHVDGDVLARVITRHALKSKSRK